MPLVAVTCLCHLSHVLTVASSIKFTTASFFYAVDSSHGMSLDELTIADVLSNFNNTKSGVHYVNHMIGKW